MKCFKCEKQLEENYTFCPHCGFKLEEVKEVAVEEEKTNKIEVVEVDPVVILNEEIEEKEEVKKEKEVLKKEEKPSLELFDKVNNKANVLILSILGLTVVFGSTLYNFTSEQKELEKEVKELRKELSAATEYAEPFFNERVFNEAQILKEKEKLEKEYNDKMAGFSQEYNEELSFEIQNGLLIGSFFMQVTPNVEGHVTISKDFLEDKVRSNIEKKIDTEELKTVKESAVQVYVNGNYVADYNNGEVLFNN